MGESETVTSVLVVELQREVPPEALTLLQLAIWLAKLVLVTAQVRLALRAWLVEAAWLVGVA